MHLTKLALLFANMKISFAFRTRLITFIIKHTICYAVVNLLFIQQQLDLCAHCAHNCPIKGLVGSNGLGPSTSRLSGVCSNQLSYEPIYGGGNRVRTDDPLLAGQVLYQLSYTPILLRSRKINAPLFQEKQLLLKTNKKETIEFPID